MRQPESKYRLLSGELVKTKACLPTGERLGYIGDVVFDLIDSFKSDTVAVERVYHLQEDTIIGAFE